MQAADGVTDSGAGRDENAVEVAYRIHAYGPNVPAQAGDGERRLMSGTPDDLLADLRALAALGVRHADIGLAATTLDGAIAELKEFGEKVRARL